MSMGDMGSVQGEDLTLKAMKEIKEEVSDRKSARQDTAQDNAHTLVSNTAKQFSKELRKGRTTLKSKFEKVKEAHKTLAKEKKGVLSDKNIKKLASKYQKQNPELRSKALLSLLKNMGKGGKSDQLLKTVRSYYDDVALADEALEFLEEASGPEEAETIKEAREQLEEESGTDVRAGRNMGTQSRAFSAKGLGSPTALRELYKEITQNPRQPNQLFKEMSSKFNFKQLKKVFSFFFHSLGSDLKAKGPSIPKGQLFQLLRETRTLQAILGVYRFFKKRTNLMKKMFEQYGLKLPKDCNFEKVAKQFMSVLGDRYPSVDSLFRMVGNLSGETGNELITKLVIISQMRDAVREVAVNELYRSVQHRDEVYATIIEALEEVEEDIEEEEEAEEEEIEGKE